MSEFWDRMDRQLRERLARRLLAAAVLVQAEHKRDLSKTNPPPHDNPAKVGQFPRARTFNLRDAVEISPRELDEIVRTGRVRVGITRNAFYGAILKRKGWKGVADTYARVRPTCMKLIGGK